MLTYKTLNKFHGFLFFASAFVYIGLVTFCNGTGDDGDSISHYLYSLQAFKHPYLFLDMWNKPIFTLLSCGFAQFGFIGVKFFNALVGIGISIYLYMILTCFKKQQLWLIMILPLCSPFYLNILNSSLTEPLFALALCMVAYFYINNNHLLAGILAGFLPFIRQEGYIIIVLLLVIYLWKKEFKRIPLLGFGHLLFSVIGVFYYGNILWIFTHNPNSSMGYYGTGGWFDYAEKLIYILGIPLYILFLVGLINKIYVTFFLKEIKQQIQKDNIIYLFLFSILFSHVIFWKFGFFKSFGMNRNIICIFPMIVFVAHDGFLYFLSWFKNKNAKKIMQIIFTSYLIIFPFTDNPAAINRKNDFRLTEKQLKIDSLAQYLKNDNHVKKYYAAHPYMIYKLGLDPFNTAEIESIDVLKTKKTSSKSVIIWDNWFSVTEARISFDELLKNPMIKLDTVIDYKNQRYLAVFKSKE